MRERSLKLKSRIWRILLAVTGLLLGGMWQACMKPDPPVAEYGVIVDDYAEIRIHGTVRSEDSLLSLPGIQVKLISPYDDTLTAVTTATGSFSIYKWAYEGDLYTLRFRDIDSLANHGWFQNRQTDISVGSREINNRELQIDVTLIKH
jgi:hypothetical protein